MGAIKRNITDISALKRGANNVAAVYRGSTLIWPTGPAFINYNITDFDNGSLGITTSQYNNTEWFSDQIYIKIN